MKINNKTISYKLKLIDSAKLTTRSLSSFAERLAEGIHKIKCRYFHKKKKCETFGITYKYCKYSLEYTNAEDAIVYKRLCCNRNYWKKFEEDSKKRFFNTSKFCKRDNNKRILMLQKRRLSIWIHGWYIMNLIHHYLKKKISTVAYIRKMLLMQIRDV